MKKRMIAALLAILMLATLLPATAFGAEKVDGGFCGGEGDGKNLEWTLDSAGALIISGTGKMKDYEYFFGSPWYSDGITSVTINSGVTSIGNYAFNWCDELIGVNIGSSVEAIGNNAFELCCELVSITIPDSVTNIGANAFAGCTGLESVTIGSGVTSIEKGAFLGDYSLPEFVVDEENTAYCSSDGVLFNKSKTELIQYPCYKSATSYTIPDSVKTIGDKAFSYCQNLYSVETGNSVTTIGDYAFEQCWNLSSVTIGNSVTSIGAYAFDDCDDLTRVTIGSSVTSIGEYAFNECISLTKVTIPVSVTSIGNKALYCDNLTNIYYRGSEDQWNNITKGQYPIPLAANITYNYTHVHDYHTTSWKSDATYHWHECSCGDQIDTAPHSFDGSTCSICGYDIIGGGGSSGGCYVATCVYGSYDCPEVWTLRRFRDETLAQTWYGRLFIRTYYAISPTIVKWFGDTDWFKNMWRGTLDKMVANLNAEGVPDTPYDDIDW